MEPIELVRVRDGRRVGVGWFGSADGTPIVRLHGVAGSSTFEVEPAWTADVGVRVITVERPGFGRSDFAPVADVLDWVTDLEDVADALGLEQFATSRSLPAGLTVWRRPIGSRTASSPWRRSARLRPSG